MSEILNGKKKLIPTQVKVNQEGYPEALCSYIKGTDGREDLFIVDSANTNDKKDVFIVTTDVVEALGRKKKSHLGAISQFGDILIPFKNENIFYASDNIFVVVSSDPTTLEVKNALYAKNSGDLSKVSELEKSKDSILAQMNDLSKDLNMLFSDPFSEARAYKVKNNPNSDKYFVEPLSLPASYIGMDSHSIYSHTNVLNSSVKAVAYNNKDKTEDISIVGISKDKVDKKIDLPSDTVPDKIEMPDNKESNVNLGSGNISSVPTYDKLFTGSGKPNDNGTSVKSVSEGNTMARNNISIDTGSSPAEQLDKINAMLEDIVHNDTTNKLKAELRQARSKIDELNRKYKAADELNKTLNDKCIDYQNESYALGAVNKDLRDKLSQYKKDNSDLKKIIDDLNSRYAKVSEKLSRTVDLFDSFVTNNNIGYDNQEVKRKAA